MTALARVAPGVRCAIYTRTSVETGAGREFSSIEHQHDTCLAYILSQRHREWREPGTRYEDAGVGGGSLVRPALQRLLADIQAGQVDIVVIYKLDRLSRSVADFLRLSDLFEKYGVTFVSVTQAFDATDNLGKLILNVLLSFAQFEREISADRTRDSIAGRAQRGLPIGRINPLGYDRVDGRLTVNEAEAAVVREIFELFVTLRRYRAVALELQKRGRLTKAWVSAAGNSIGGKLMHPYSVHEIVRNRIYIGEVGYRGKVYPACHPPIVSRELWDAVQAVRAERSCPRHGRVRTSHLLAGLLFDHCGLKMLPNTATRRSGLRYYYYIAAPSRARGAQRLRRYAVDAPAIDGMVLNGICQFLRNRGELEGLLRKHELRGRHVDAVLDKGPAAARHLETLERSQLGLTYEHLIRRVEISSERVRIILGCEELLAWLARGGSGPLLAPGRTRSSASSVHLVEFDAASRRPERRLADLLVAPEAGGCPDRALIERLALARAVQEAVCRDRHLSFEAIADRFKRRPSYLARVFRLNYLAPDIQLAIRDGRQPADLTWRRLVYGYVPMDWHEQRSMFGFPPKPERRRGLGNYSRTGPGVRVDAPEIGGVMTPESPARPVLEAGGRTPGAASDGQI